MKLFFSKMTSGDKQQCLKTVLGQIRETSGTVWNRIEYWTSIRGDLYLLPAAQLKDLRDCLKKNKKAIPREVFDSGMTLVNDLRDWLKLLKKVEYEFTSPRHAQNLIDSAEQHFKDVVKPSFDSVYHLIENEIDRIENLDAEGPGDE